MTPEPTSRTTAPTYHEQLRLSWWAWPAALVVDLILGLEIAFGFPDVPMWAPITVLLPPTALLLYWAGRIRVEVAGGEFRVDDAALPVAVISDVVALDAAGKREALGVGWHPHAFAIQRPWVGPAVQVLVDDPADPTPFWVVSTRRPVELATTLLAARDAGRAGN